MEPLKKNAVAFALLALLLASCGVTKDYTRPELKLPASFNNSIALPAHQFVEIPNLSAFFKDIELLALLEKVMKKNPDLLMAAEQILASEALLKSVKLNYLPEINLQMNAGVQRLSKNSMLGSFSGGLLFEEYNFAPAISWDIDFWGKLKRERKAATASYLGLAAYRRAIRVQLIAQTAQAYYNLVGLDEQLRITQEVEKSMQKTLAMLKTQYAVGEASSLAVDQAEAQLAETKALIPEIKASITAQENALQALAGDYPDAIKRAQSFQKKIFGTEIEAGIPIHLLANRPDVRQQELVLQVATERVGIAKTEFYPSLKITGQGGSNATNLSNWFAVPASLFGTAAAGLTQPIFNRRGIKAAYEQALHQREAAVHAFRKSVIAAVEEVSTALSNVARSREQMVEVNKRKTAMDSAIHDAQLLYKYGEANYLEVLTVQQNYFQSELAFTAAVQQEINTYIALYKSLGGI